MFLEKTKNPSRLYALIGTKEELRTLRNILSVAHDVCYSFSHTEATILHEVDTAIYRVVKES